MEQQYWIFRNAKKGIILHITGKEYCRHFTLHLKFVRFAPLQFFSFLYFLYFSILLFYFFLYFLVIVGNELLHRSKRIKYFLMTWNQKHWKNHSSSLTMVANIDFKIEQKFLYIQLLVASSFYYLVAKFRLVFSQKSQ